MNVKQLRQLLENSDAAYRDDFPVVFCVHTDNELRLDVGTVVFREVDGVVTCCLGVAAIDTITCQWLERMLAAPAPGD